MHQHGPKCLPGPIRGTPGWWQELGKVPDSAPGAYVPGAPATKKKRPRKRRHHHDSSGPQGPTMRTELVERIRREIAAGTYDSPEKWEAALDRLLENLGGTP